MRASALKSTPWPGFSVMLETMSAMRSWPLARRPATACSLVTPAGICLLTTPSKRMLVALPRILGPTTAKATLTTASSTTRMSRTRSALSMPARRRMVPLKSLALAVGITSAWPPGPPGPGPWGPRGRGGAASPPDFTGFFSASRHATPSTPSCEVTISR